MIEINLIWILVLIAYVSSFLLFMLFNLINIKKNKNTYSFLNQFPFEYLTNRTSDILLYVFAGISFTPLLVIIPCFGEMADLAIFNVLLACVFGMSGFVIALIYKISTSYLNVHFKIMTGLFCLAFLLSALTALHFFLSYSTYARVASNGTYYLIFGILSSLLSVLMFVLLFNPKLKDWAHLEAVTNEDEISYIRPKFISLAYSEWLSIAVVVISEILFLLSLLKI